MPPARQSAAVSTLTLPPTASGRKPPLCWQPAHRSALVCAGAMTRVQLKRSKMKRGTITNNIAAPGITTHLSEHPCSYTSLHDKLQKPWATCASDCSSATRWRNCAASAALGSRDDTCSATVEPRECCHGDVGPTDAAHGIVTQFECRGHPAIDC